MANDDIKFVKENSLASKPITEADLDKPFIVIGFMKNEKGSGGKQTKGNIQEIRKRGDVYDIYQGDELRPSSRGVSKEEILRLYSQEATAGYMYKATSKQDPKLAKWINVDDEDIYINRLTDEDPLSPLKFKGESKKPVADIDYKAKIKDGSITVREAFEAVLSKNLSKSKKDTIGPLFKALPDEGVDLDAPYFEVYNTRKFAEAMDYTTNTSGVHRYKEFGSFETELDGLIGDTRRYKRLSDSNKAKGIASTEFSLTGTQLRNADPMRATVPSEALDKIYNDALFPVGSSEVDTKRGLDRPTIIDPEARDYLLYEKYTGQRAQSNIGADGLKISDFNFFTDENNNTVVEVASKKVGNKTRPEVTYTGEFAEFLRNKVERAKGSLPPDADLSKVNLFQTTPAAVTKLWDSAIRPALEKDWKNALPAKKGGSHSTVRKILARQLVAEFKFPRDAVKAWMGHAGAGVDAAGDILDDNYIGTVPDERIGGMTNALVQTDAFNTKANNVNTMFVNRGAGYSQEVLFETPTKKPMGNNPDVNFAGFKGLGRDPTLGELEEISALASSRAVETEILTEGRRQYLSKLQSERRTATPKPMIPEPFEPGEAVSSSLQNALQDNGFTVDDLDGIYDSLVKRAEPVVKAVGTAIETVEKIPGAKKALVAATVASGYQAGKAKAEELGLPSVAQEAAGVVSGASELTPFALSDIADTFSGFGVAATEEQKRIDELRRRGQTYAANRVAIEDAGMDTEPDTRLPATRRQQQADRIAREDTGFIPEPDRVPEAAPVEEQGFLSR